MSRTVPPYNIMRRPRSKRDTLPWIVLFQHMTVARASTMALALAVVRGHSEGTEDASYAFHMRAIKAIAANMAVDLGVKVERW